MKKEAFNKRKTLMRENLSKTCYWKADSKMFT